MSWRYAMWHRLLETQIAHQTFKRQTTACAWFGDCECSENSHKCEELFVFPNVQGPRVQVHKWWLENGSSSWLRTGRKGRLTSIPFRKEQLQICGSFISSLSQHLIDTKVTLSITMTILFDLISNKTPEQQKHHPGWVSRSSGFYRRFDRCLVFGLLHFHRCPNQLGFRSLARRSGSHLSKMRTRFSGKMFWSICSECICVYIQMNIESIS